MINFVGSRVLFGTLVFGSKIGTQKFCSMEQEAAPEAEGVHEWGAVASEGPATAPETPAVAADETAAAAATVALTQEQKKALGDAKKEVKVGVTRKLLQSVGVSTMGDRQRTIGNRQAGWLL